MEVVVIYRNRQTKEYERFDKYQISDMEAFEKTIKQFNENVDNSQTVEINTDPLFLELAKDINRSYSIRDLVDELQDTRNQLSDLESYIDSIVDILKGE